MYVKINASVLANNGRQITVDAPEVEFDNLDSTVKQINRVLDSFQKDEKAEEPRHTGGSGKDSEQKQEHRLYCSKCQRTWYGIKPTPSFIHYDRDCKHCKSKNCVTVIKPKKSESPETSIMVQTVRDTFKLLRDKMHDDRTLSSIVNELSEAETWIIQTLIYR